MKLIIDREEIKKAPIESILHYFSEVDQSRLRKVTGEHYRFLLWLSLTLNNQTIYDIGTRSGASAACLSFNPTHKVTSFDIVPDHWKKYNTSPEIVKNVCFKTYNIKEMPIEELNKPDIILLDIDHTGKIEKIVYDKLLKSKFSGILIMDDINVSKWGRLKKLFDSITKPKLILDIAHWSGTGIVSFGPEIEVKNKWES